MNPATSSPVTNVLLTGVGGQGIILASELLSAAALEAGLEVKKSEVHGMAQRGGSVVSHVRFGTRVDSPLIPRGEGNFLVAFEEMEALRYLPLLKKDGVVILNRQKVHTMAMLLGETPYPEDSLQSLKTLPIRLSTVNGPELAREAGNPRTVNVAILGALSSHLGFSREIWSGIIAGRVPEKYVEVNIRAFELGAGSA